MKDIMHLIYEVLSQYGNVSYGDISRNKDGVADFSDTHIVYSLPSRRSSVNNKVRTDIDLVIDIWYKPEDIYDIEIIIEDIDNDLSDQIWVDDKLQVVQFAKSPNYITEIHDPNMGIRRKQVNYTLRYYK